MTDTYTDSPQKPCFSGNQAEKRKQRRETSQLVEHPGDVVPKFQHIILAHILASALWAPFHY